MAYADYRLCDVCGCKAFYDSNLNYEWSTKNNPLPEAEQIKDGGRPSGMKLMSLGDWSVICVDCAKTHKTIIVPIEGEMK